MPIATARAPVAPLGEDAYEHRAIPEVLSMRGVRCELDRTVVLDGVSLAVGRGTIRGLVGPNGAGKTTLLRLAAGMVGVSEGDILVAGHRPDLTRNTAYRNEIGFVSSGSQSFYKRLTGRENLVFFGRLRGLDRRTATGRADELLEAVGLAPAARRRVGTFSQGMNRRLAVARALLTAPSVLLVDEATHDVDPAGGDVLRALVRSAAAAGAGVLWATQRLDELVGFAGAVSVLIDGRVRYDGSVTDLMEHAERPRFLLRLRDGEPHLDPMEDRLSAVLRGRGSLTATGALEHYLLDPSPGQQLGELLATLNAAGYELLTCREERPALELALQALQRRAEVPAS